MWVWLLLLLLLLSVLLWALCVVCCVVCVACDVCVMCAMCVCVKRWCVLCVLVWCRCVCVHACPCWPSGHNFRHGTVSSQSVAPTSYVHGTTCMYVCEVCMCVCCVRRVCAGGCDPPCVMVWYKGVCVCVNVATVYVWVYVPLDACVQVCVHRWYA